MSKRFKQLAKEVNDFIQEKIWVGVPDVVEDVGLGAACHTLALVNGVYFQSKEFDKALEISKIIIKLGEIGDNPKLEHYANLAYILHKTEKYEECEKVCQKALEIQKEYELEDSIDLYYNYAVNLKDMGKYEEAVEYFNKTLEINPDFSMSHYQLSNVLMALGKYKEGMAEDEWRFEAHSGLARFKKRFKKPDWIGTPNETVLVFSEQGFGDAIMNARYLKNLKQVSKKVILEIQEELYHLFTNNPYVDEVIARDNLENNTPKFPPCDSVVSINSLPYWFDLGYENIPLKPYIKANYDAPDCIKVEYLDYGAFKGKKVGIIWAGSQWHSADKVRSCFLKDFAPLFDVPNIKIYSLQTGEMNRTWCHGKTLLWEGTNDYDIVNLLSGAENLIPKIFDPMPNSKNFNDTAIIIDQLDLLISVDTAVVHMAGAMGKPVWVLLPYAHEWRWLKQWYPDTKYFRQEQPGDWGGLLKLVSNKVDKWANS